MAGRGRVPKENRMNPRDTPVRGEWQRAEGGWQGPIPKPPTGMLKASRDAWETWFSAWFAAHWTTADLPGLRQVIRLYDQVERGEFQRATELRLQMDTYGITPKGQQDRRWKPPEAVPASAPPVAQGMYGHLRAVD